MKFSELVHSSGWKAFMAKLYGIGASIVILGALFKLQHWQGANLMLIIGLGTEAIIFFFSAFEPLHEEVDWTLVYPELAGLQEDPADMPAISRGRSRPVESYGGGGSSAALTRFDQMVENAEITPDLFERLGHGLKNLNATAAKLADISDASLATHEYVSNIKSAALSVNSLTESLDASTHNLKGNVTSLSDAYTKNAEAFQRSSSQLTESYEQLSQSVNTENSVIMEGNKSIGEKLGALNKNLSALNAVYELQLQNNNEHLKGTQSLYSDISKITGNLKDSVEQTEKYKEEISKLSQNLSELNSIYGNMLSAMSMVSKR